MERVRGGTVRRSRTLAVALVVVATLALSLRANAVAATVAGAVEEWGDDYYAQDGFDSGSSLLRGAQASPVPLPITTQTAVGGVETGFSHSLALKSGNVWAWGRATEGQLGDGTFGPGTAPGRATPVEVHTSSASLLTGVIAVAGGGYHSLALTSGGNVYAWGSDSNGQLGDGTTTNSAYALEVKVNSTTFLSGVTAIAAGRYHSLALKSDGTVWAWGYDFYGQLGNGANTDSSFAVQVTDSTSAALSSVTDIAGGGWHSLAVKSDGSVWAWGYNLLGQLGDGTTTDRNRAVQVQSGSGNLATGTTSSLAWPLHRLAAGNFHSLALASNGTVFAWGSNSSGQLDFVDTSLADKQTKAVQAAGLAQVTSIAAGQNHGLALVPGGGVLAWGSDGAGQLGDGTHGAPTCWCRLAPAPVAGLAAATDIAAGGDNSAAVVT